MTLGNRWPDELTLRIFGKDRTTFRRHPCRYSRISEDGCFALHFSHVVSSDESFGSHLLKYFPWIPIRPFLYGYHNVFVSRSYSTKVFR